jgi:predicted CXXCH cytochrome family protein
MQAANAFKGWTARLLRATYNFQLATKDPGAFAHNAKYIIELLYDSIQDVNQVLIVPVDMTRAVRTDVGHFDGAGEPARHWDTNDQVDATCSSCHGGQEGFRFYVQYGVGQVVQETANGLECGTCHDKPGIDFTAIAAIPSVTFPSGVKRQEPGHDNLCESCHHGRESKATVDAQIATGKYKFLNVHYLPAGATKLGSAVHVGYEYDGKTYAGPLSHVGGTQCTSCHDPAGSHHTFQITAAKLLAAMQAVAPLCYDGDTYPYFFKDTNGDKQCAAAELTAANGFAAFTPALMKASFNYQLSRKEPGAWAHNFDYMAQLLYDSIADLGGSTAALTRP